MADRLTNLDFARELGVTPQRVSVLKREGMPVDSIASALAWREERRSASRARAPKPLVTSLDDGTLAGTISEHRRLVEQARGVWLAAMETGDNNQGKFQTAYNQSLKTLVQLEAEQERRSIMAKDFIPASEAADAMRQLMAEVVNRLDKLALDVAEACNPGDPPKAVKALEAWVLKTRRDLSNDEEEKTRGA